MQLRTIPHILPSRRLRVKRCKDSSAPQDNLVVIAPPLRTDRWPSQTALFPHRRIQARSDSPDCLGRVVNILLPILQPSQGCPEAYKPAQGGDKLDTRPV